LAGALGQSSQGALRDRWHRHPVSGAREAGLRAVTAPHYPAARGEPLDEVAAAVPPKPARIGIAAGLQSLYTATEDYAREAVKPETRQQP
jgi:hypothetical protein